MNSIIINSFLTGNAFYTLLGFLLFVTAFVFIFRNIRKGSGYIPEEKTAGEIPAEDTSGDIFIEKDVFGLDKAPVIKDYDSYEPLKKFNLSILVLIVMGLIGLALIYYGSIRQYQPEINPGQHDMIESSE